MTTHWTACLLAAALSPVPATPQVTAIAGATVFDSLTGAALPDHTVVIERDRIQAVGPRRATAIPKGATVINARGKYLIPGLIDGHVHLMHVLDFAHVTADEILPLFLAHGVTTVRDTGDQVYAQKLLARHAEQRPESCPRVMLCSPLLDADPPFHKDIGYALTDPAKVPEVVADMKAWDVTTLKLYVGMTREVGRRVIEEGQRQGLAVTGHLGRYTAQEAVADGIDSLEHIWSVFNFILPPLPKDSPGRTRLEARAHADLDSAKARELIAAIANRKVAVGPNLVVFRNMLLLHDTPEVANDPDHATVPARLRTYWADYRRRTNLSPDTLELRRKEFRKYQDLTGILHRAQVPLLAGTDTPEPFTPPGSSLHRELALLVESGLTPAAALQAATIENARIIRQTAHLGSITKGKLADLVLLEADPLASIQNTRKVIRVFRNGVSSDPKALLKAVPAE